MENTTTPVSPSSVGIRYGLIVGLITTIISFLQLAFISDPETPLRWLGAVVGIGGIILAHKYFKQHNGGFMTYGQGLGIGTILAGVGGLLSSIFTYIYMNFIDSDYMNRVMELTRSRMEEKGMDDAQIDQAMAMAQKFSSGPITIVFGVLMSVLMGFVISLIISAITKHTRPEFE
jgi:tetrahydromethanopterin S-methyltransferase subunit G